MLLSSVHKPCQGRIIILLSIKDSGQYATNSVVESALSRTIHAFQVVPTASSSSIQVELFPWFLTAALLHDSYFPDFHSIICEATISSQTYFYSLIFSVLFRQFCDVAKVAMIIQRHI